MRKEQSDIQANNPLTHVPGNQAHIQTKKGINCTLVDCGIIHLFLAQKAHRKYLFIFLSFLKLFFECLLTVPSALH